jgi:rhodanese-related sulfurtransferase
MDVPLPISPTDAVAAIAAGEAILVDVRDAAAFDAEHPTPARSIPIDQLEDHLEELADAPLVITSCGGGTRGPKAAAALAAKGIRARPMQGGLRGWRSAGAPTTAE